MKLIIQIPCYNEENTLPQVIADLPKSLPGIDVIETQVIDDGSTDYTVRVAKELGVDHVIELGKNKGLAVAFKSGVNNALNLDADYLVNTDGDNQYQGKDIIKLMETAMSEKADLVVGCRPIKNHPEFSFFKKRLQYFGSWVLRKVSGTSIKDAASGFRVYSRNAMLHLNIYSDFSYCMETLIQLGVENMTIIGVDIGVNPKTRKSRLFSSVLQYLWRQSKTIVSIFLLYRTNVLFGFSALLTFIVSFVLAIRYFILILFSSAPASNFWPTIILAGVLLIISVLLYITGILASLLVANRKLSEEVLYRLRKNNANQNREEYHT